MEPSTASTKPAPASTPGAAHAPRGPGAAAGNAPTAAAAPASTTSSSSVSASSSGKGLEVLKLLREASSEVHTSTDFDAALPDKPASGKGPKVQILAGEVEDVATADDDAVTLLKAMGKTPTTTPKTILKGSSSSGDGAAEKTKPLTQSDSPERARGGPASRRPQSAGLPQRGGGRGDSSDDREDEYRSSGGGGSRRVPRARRSGGAQSDPDSDGPERRSTSSSFSLNVRYSPPVLSCRRSTRNTRMWCRQGHPPWPSVCVAPTTVPGARYQPHPAASVLIFPNAAPCRMCVSLSGRAGIVPVVHPGDDVPPHAQRGRRQ